MILPALSVIEKTAEEALIDTIQAAATAIQLVIVDLEGGASEPKKVAPTPVPFLRRGRRRTGRTVTITLKTTAEHSNRFYALAGARNWLVGETFEHTLHALEEKLQREGEGR